MPVARVNGIELAYEEYGSGTPLVLAHGYTATKEMWDGQVAAFSAKYRLITYDVRGHGGSSAPHVDDAGYTMDTLVSDQAALMDELGIERAYVGGLSLGGMIAMRFALTHPERVTALLLCDTSPGMGMEGQFAANRLLMEALVRSQGVGTVMRNLYAQRAGSSGVPKLEHLPEGVQAHIKRLETMKADGFLGVAKAAGDATSVLERLPELSVPVLIVTGDLDFFRGASEAMHERLPGSRFVMIEHSAHGTALWQPQAFTDAVLGFLDDVDAGRPVASP